MARPVFDVRCGISGKMMSWIVVNIGMETGGMLKNGE
jgi:hypothetical protein